MRNSNKNDLCAYVIAWWTKSQKLISVMCIVFYSTRNNWLFLLSIESIILCTIKEIFSALYYAIKNTRILWLFIFLVCLVNHLFRSDEQYHYIYEAGMCVTSSGFSVISSVHAQHDKVKSRASAVFFFSMMISRNRSAIDVHVVITVTIEIWLVYIAFFYVGVSFIFYHICRRSIAFLILLFLKNTKVIYVYIWRSVFRFSSYYWWWVDR